MPVPVMTPEEIIAAVQSGIPLYAPRCAGKRLTFSIVSQMMHLIKLEEAYDKLKRERANESPKADIDICCKCKEEFDENKNNDKEHS